MELNPTKAVPWVTIHALPFLKKVAHGHVFEWGSGASTLFFSQRCESVISIENVREWHGRVMNAMQRHSIRNVTLELIECDPGKHPGDGSDPYSFFSDSAIYGDRRFERYVKAINQREDDSLDLIMVDGRARSSCLVLAIPKVAPRGVLILDDASRSHYEKAIRVVDKKGWQRHRFPSSRNKMPLIAWQRP